MKNIDSFEFEFNILQQHLKELHVLNVSENAPGDPEVYRLLESAGRIQQSDFLLSTSENAETCSTINRCIGAVNKIINEKIQPDRKHEKGIFLNENATTYHTKEIIKNDKNNENKDFLGNIIKGCEILGNTVYTFQKTNCVSKNECVTDIYKAAYSVAKNLTKILKQDEELKSFFSNHHLRIDEMLQCPQETRYIKSFIEDQEKNYKTVKDKAKLVPPISR